MSNAFTLKIDQDNIAEIVFDLPGEKVNKISRPVMEEFDQLLDELIKRPDIKGATIASGKKDIFIAGADLHSFEPIFRDPAQGRVIISEGHRVLNKLASLPFPTVALINGACLGGGMELALACSYRIVSDNQKTVLGLPEVTLGIIPGWGGTQRAPRLVGLTEGLAMILGGKPLKAQKAWKIHLADAIVPAEFFEKESKALVREIFFKQGKQKIDQKRKSRTWSQKALETNPLGRAIVFRQAEAEVRKKTKGHYPAPLVALKLVKDTYHLPLKEGLQEEINTFVDNLSSAFIQAPNLIHLFFTSEALKKDKGNFGDTAPKAVRKAAVIGAGTMGSGIAWLLSNQDIFVRLKDVDWAAIGKGYGAANAIYSKLLKDKRIKPADASLKFHHLSGTVDYSGFGQVDLVLEAAVENLDLKTRILQEVELHVPKETIIGTNTSSLTIRELNASMKHPERLVGMHFFNPPNRMPLVEVIASDLSSKEAIATAVDLCRKLGKTPIVVRDCPGFLVNRIFVPGANEVMLMFQEGTDFEKLEKAMLGFGMPMSPFILADEVGNDVGEKVSKVFHAAYGERMVVPQLLTLMNEHKLYGKKSGKGFYIYSGDAAKERNRQVEELKNSLKIPSNPTPDDDIVDRVIFTMINEASRCLYTVIDEPAYLDMALIMGIGFPPFRGGLLRYADHVGIDHVVKKLQAFEKVYGPRFAPSEKLLEMQRDNKTFFSTKT